ncbi:hypothetical protein TTHT_1835 [Thermotomaculum hydrothermale]|uniref:Tetratricopeptide repeat protein n=1 Tax=Thermotomaculum hydrothermale TaxID=981385 RepID=A0A7R6PP80_9BACT|nr:tetratricopeptide repeat protein [Thermotomaculum hydrothermale]BBB33293.1 hypothetical protein TTHT_1835 [Thermotomaculum hydrothermale]
MKRFFVMLCLVLTFGFAYGQTATSLYNKVMGPSTKHIEKGKKYLKKNKISKAEKEFKDAIKSWKHAYAAYAYLGIIYYQKRDFNKSKEYFEKSIKEFAAFKENFLKMKLDYMKEFQRKAKELQIELDKHDMQYQGINATAYETKKVEYENKYKNMKKEYEKDKNMQYDAFFRFKYGNTLMALKDFKGAIEQYSAAINQDPNLKDAYTNLSVAYFVTGDCANAVKYYKIAKEKKAKINKNFERDLKKRCRVN